MRLSFSILFLIIYSYSTFQANGATLIQEKQELYYQNDRLGILSEKIFPFLTLLAQTPEYYEYVKNNQKLEDLLEGKKQYVVTNLIDEGQKYNPVAETVSMFKLSNEEIAIIREQLVSAVKSGRLSELTRQMRQLKRFSYKKDLDDQQLVHEAVIRELEGVNRLIDTYALGVKPKYAHIDSVSYNVNSRYYNWVIQFTALTVMDDFEKMELAFQPTLHFTLWLLDVNNRDEAARFEPLGKGENSKAVEQIKHTNWDDYAYTLIMVPGHGPEEDWVELSPLGKIHCKLAADRYKQGLAPFIVVSGGYVHPFQTPVCEAIVMKEELMNRYQIPESAVIIEPYARHTTTNFRNTARLMHEYGIPMDRKALCTTTKDQSNTIRSERFYNRCLAELGYLPYIPKERLSRNDVEFIPQMESLFIDNMDPLDP